MIDNLEFYETDLRYVCTKKSISFDDYRDYAERWKKVQKIFGIRGEKNDFGRNKKRSV